MANRGSLGDRDWTSGSLNAAGGASFLSAGGALAAGQARYFAPGDSLGTIDSTLDAVSGVSVRRPDVDAYRATVVGMGHSTFAYSAPNRFATQGEGAVSAWTTVNGGPGYTGEWHESIAGLNLIYLRDRDLHPELGQFLRRDSYEGDPRDPISRTAYEYGGIDPVSERDPSGYSPSVENAAPGHIRHNLIARFTPFVARVRSQISAACDAIDVDYELKVKPEDLRSDPGAYIALALTQDDSDLVLKWYAGSSKM